MRYQRVSPECPPLSNGKKSNFRSTEEETTTPVSSIVEGGGVGGGGSKLLRFRPSSRLLNNTTTGVSDSGGGDIGTSTSPPPLPLPLPPENNNHHDGLLQWGHRKRSRFSRTANSPDHPSSSVHHTQSTFTRRAVPSNVNGRASNHVNALLPTKESSGSISTRNSEEHLAVGANGSPPSRNNGGGNHGNGNHRPGSRSTAGKRSAPSIDKADKKTLARSTRVEKQNGSFPHTEPANNVNSTPLQLQDEKVNSQVCSLPRIYIGLSRKEKDDDFLTIKGTKLPHRPKKRSKTVEKGLQYCFPGMYLADLTKTRYEVREKKGAKKQKRRGLKGMDSMDTDSD